ncbi:MAG: MFS transporter [Clostridia bacterium]|nr:MFS transporter [Clostridia bacterium]
MKDRSRVTLAEKLGFMTFSCSTNIAYNFKSMYYFTFLTLVLRIDVLVAGTMLTLGTIWDAVNDPLIALFCANHKFKSGEKLRPYALYCCVPWAVTIVLIFCNFNLSEKLTVIVGLLSYFVFEGLYTFLCMPYNSLASVATSDDSERKSINAFRSLGGCLGSGLGAVAILPLVKMFGGLRDHKIINETDSPALIKTAILMGVICIIGSLFHYFTSKERVLSEGDEEKINLLQAYRMLFKCKSWVLNMCYIIGYGIILAFVLQNINYYASYVLGETAKALPIQAVYLVFAVITSLACPKIDALLGRRKTMILAIAVMVVGKIPFILNPYSMISIYINALTVAFGATTTFVMFNTNRNNIADVLAVQNDRRIDSLVAGGDNLISKLSEAFAIQMMSVAYKFAGFDEALGINQTPETINTINALLGWLPALVALLMTFFALKIDIPKELAEAKAKKGIA